MVTTVFDFYPRDPERRKEIDKGKEIRWGKDALGHGCLSIVLSMREIIVQKTCSMVEVMLTFRRT